MEDAAGVLVHAVAEDEHVRRRRPARLTDASLRYGADRDHTGFGVGPSARAGRRLTVGRLNAPRPRDVDAVRPTGTGAAMKWSCDLITHSTAGLSGPALAVGVAGALRVAAVGGPRPRLGGEDCTAEAQRAQSKNTARRTCVMRSSVRQLASSVIV